MSKTTLKRWKNIYTWGESGWNFRPRERNNWGELLFFNRYHYYNIFFLNIFLTSVSTVTAFSLNPFSLFRKIQAASLNKMVIIKRPRYEEGYGANPNFLDPGIRDFSESEQLRFGSGVAGFLGVTSQLNIYIFLVWEKIRKKVVSE